MARRRLCVMTVFSLMLVFGAEARGASTIQEADPQAGQAVADAYLAQALARRGHTGDRAFLQGCDLTDVKLDAARTRDMLAKRLTDRQAYQDAIESGRLEQGEVRLSTSPVDASAVQVVLTADQAARSALVSDLPEGEVATLILDLRFQSLCEIDFRTGDWLSTPSVKSFFEETEDGAVIQAIMVLALHMDHLPALQIDYAESYLRLMEKRSLPLEIGLRLMDRGLVNRGLPQKYATLILCKEGAPEFAGRVDVHAANMNRRAMGMPDQSLSELGEGYCG